MQTYSSRLQSRKDQRAKRNAAFLLVGSVLAAILIVFFGIKIVFGLTGAISSMRNKTTTNINQEEDNYIPSRPSFNQEFAATKSAQVSLSGNADTGIQVEISQNNRTIGTFQADETGKFKFEADLEKGRNFFVATAISTKNKRSDSSETYEIILASKPPKLEELFPKDNDTVKESPINFSGTTDDGSVSISVNDHLAIVKSDGRFSTNLSLSGGDNKVKVVARDQAGNETTKEITIKFSP